MYYIMHTCINDMLICIHVLYYHIILYYTIIITMCPHDNVDTVTPKAKQYQWCNTLVTRFEVRIMRIKDEGQGCVASHPHVPNNNTGIILSIIPVIILGIIYYSSSIENTTSIIYYCTCLL